jgi:lytic murein transglycosylase
MILRSTLSRFAPAIAALLIGATAVSAQECGIDFATWKAAVRTEAEKAGVGPKGLAAFDAAQYDTRALARDRAQTVFTQTFDQFSGKLISQQRLSKGQANLHKYADIFSRAEEEYGASPYVITAFWALETDYGAIQGDFTTINAILTLAHDCRRPDLFKPQIIPLLKLIDTNVLPADVKGAWAGEIGQTQILPTDYLARGIDGDGDGMVDLRNDVADVIMTTANKLKHRGWKAKEPWVEEVKLPENLPWDQTGRTNKLPLSQWAEWGVTRRDGSPLTGDAKAGLVLPMGYKGPAFLAYDNFDVYLQWNQSALYALTAAYMATRLSGAPAFDLRNPEQGLSFEDMKALQEKLQAKGYDVGKIDGILGAGTREAVRQEQIKLGLVVDGWPTPELLARI